MAIRAQHAVILLAAAFCPPHLRGQNTQDAPCTVSPAPQPCAAGPAKPSGANFPFPGAPASGTSASAPTADSHPAAAPASAAPAKPSGAAFPFPGDTTPATRAKAPGAAFPFPGGDATPASPTGESSSSSSSSSSSDAPTPNAPPDASADADTKPALKDEGSHGRRLLPRVNPKGTKLQTVEEREAEDLDIAHYYLQTGNLKGAYLRTQDAVKSQPDDPDAHFALAETARRLDKKDEAVAEYTACLKLDPDPKKAAAARKALAALKP